MKPRRRPALRPLALLGLALALLSGCGKQPPTTPEDRVGDGSGAASGDTVELRIAMSQEFENPNPTIMQMAATSYIYHLVGRTLNTLDPQAQLADHLAVRTPTLENGGATLDHATLTTAAGEEVGQRRHLSAKWEIRPEAKWGDGTPITGHDVAFSHRVGLADTVSVGEREVYADIERIEVDEENPKRFTVHYAKAKWDFYKMFSFYVLPQHLEGPVFERHRDTPGAYEKASLYVTDPTNPGLYSGPYRVTEVQLGSHVIVERNEHFYGLRPQIDRIVLKFIPNTATLESNLRAGEVDMISHLGLGFDQALSLSQRGVPGTTSHFQPGLFYEHLDLNLRDPILRDRRVRQALVYALDRQELCEALFAGRQLPAYHNLAPIDPWYTDDPARIQVYEFDPEQAIDLLEAAGWRLADDGIRTKGGQRLVLTIMTTAGDKTREAVQQYLQESWREIGVELTIRNEPARVFFGETVRKGQYPHLAMFAWLSSPENTPRSTLHSGSIPTAENGWSGQNTNAWANPEVDALIETVEQSFDADERRARMHELLGIYTREVPTIPLYYRSYNSVTPAGLRGYRLSPHQFPATTEAENWVLE